MLDPDRMLNPESLTSDQQFMFMLLERVNALEESCEELREKVKKHENKLFPMPTRESCVEALELLGKIQSRLNRSDREKAQEERAKLEEWIPSEILGEMDKEQIHCAAFLKFYITHTTQDFMSEERMDSILYWCQRILKEGVANPKIVEWMKEKINGMI